MDNFEEEEIEEVTKFSKCLSNCRKVTTFLLSHVGLISLVISYCVLGAFTFESLEKQHELNVKNNMSHVRGEVSKYLWDMTKKSDVIKPEEWKKNAYLRLQTFETDLIRLMKKGGWDGNELNTTQQWTFSGALFYSIVVITTIGYGNLAPKTDWGKIVTIFYAILGIPLMLLCLSHIGDFMATAFRVLYWKVCCYMCNRRVPRFATPPPTLYRGRSVRGSTRNPNSRGPARRSIRTRSARTSQKSHDSAYSDSPTDIKANNQSAFRRVRSNEDFRKVSTNAQSSHIQPPTFSRHSPSPRINPTAKSPSAIAVTKKFLFHHQRSTKSAEPNFIAGIQSNFPVICNRYAEEAPCSSHIQKFEIGDEEAQQSFYRKKYVQPVVLEQFEIDEYLGDVVEGDEEWESEVRKRPVPIWLCVLLVISYILGGATLFSRWENWTFLDSAYFSFVTLTTIGFGDYVPSSAQKSSHVDVEVSIALCSLYLLFGISLLAMSFNLVQEQVISSVKIIASRLGIIKEEEL